MRLNALSALSLRRRAGGSMRLKRPKRLKSAAASMTTMLIWAPSPGQDDARRERKARRSSARPSWLRVSYYNTITVTVLASGLTCFS